MSIPQIEIDLHRPPDERWAGLSPYLDQGRQLLAQYAADLGGIAPFQDLIGAYREACIAADDAAELAAIARRPSHDMLDATVQSSLARLDLVTCGFHPRERLFKAVFLASHDCTDMSKNLWLGLTARMVGASPDEVLVVNLYYDLLKVVLGCTAFAVDTEQGPLHARNLDWWTDNALLARATLAVTVHGAPAGPFHLVSWPGFIGALSGVAPGRFAISLNAVLSDEPPAFAPPITFVLRSVFETARTFTEAVDRLSVTEIASDCLLLVTGIQAGEMVVVERTPTRAAVRHPERGRLVVANDYLALATASAEGQEGRELQRTSCDRFERACTLLTAHLPQTTAECYAVLTDPHVRMGLTVQHMVLSAARGLMDVRLPDACGQSV